MPRATARSDASNLIVPRGTTISLVLFQGSLKFESKAKAKRTLLQGLSLGLSMDMRKDLDGQWVVYLSQLGVVHLRRKWEWTNPSMAKRNKNGTRRVASDIRHQKVKVRPQLVINDWVPGEVRRSDYTQEEIDQFTYGEIVPNEPLDEPKSDAPSTSESRSWLSGWTKQEGS